MLQHSYASLISINTFHQWICSRGITKLQSSELGTVDRIHHVIHHVIHLLQYISKHIDHLFQSSSTQFNTYTRYISGIYISYFKKSPAPAWRAGSRIRRRRGNLRGSCLSGLAFVTGEAAKHCWIGVICNYPMWWYDRYNISWHDRTWYRYRPAMICMWIT